MRQQTTNDTAKALEDLQAKQKGYRERQTQARDALVALRSSRQEAFLVEKDTSSADAKLGRLERDLQDLSVALERVAGEISQAEQAHRAAQLHDEELLLVELRRKQAALSQEMLDAFALGYAKAADADAVLNEVQAAQTRCEALGAPRRSWAPMREAADVAGLDGDIARVAAGR